MRAIDAGLLSRPQIGSESVRRAQRALRTAGLAPCRTCTLADARANPPPPCTSLPSSALSCTHAHVPRRLDVRSASEPSLSEASVSEASVSEASVSEASVSELTEAHYDYSSEDRRSVEESNSEESISGASDHASDHEDSDDDDDDDGMSDEEFEEYLSALETQDEESRRARAADADAARFNDMFDYLNDADEDDDLVGDEDFQNLMERRR